MPTITRRFLQAAHVLICINRDIADAQRRAPA
jgi:hypothetical protein